MRSKLGLMCRDVEREGEHRRCKESVGTILITIGFETVILIIRWHYDTDSNGGHNLI
jgi:hypothetical protein